MDEIKPKGPVSDEIDIAQIFRWIGNGFRNLALLILAGVAGLRYALINNKIFFGLLIFASIIVAAFYFTLLEKKYYKTSMILSCDYLNSRIMENTLDKLNQLCSEADRKGLEQEIGIDSLTAKNIITFSFRPFVAEQDVVELEVLKEQLNNVAENKKDLVTKIVKRIDIENKHAFLIEVDIYNPDIVENLEKSLVAYLGNNSYVKNRVEAKHATLLNRKEKLIRESKKLDSLKSVIYANFQTMAKQASAGSNNVILSDKYMTNPMEVFDKDLNYDIQISEIDKELSIRSDFEVIDGFTSFKAPESAGFIKIVIIAIGLAIGLGYLLIGLRNFNNYLATFK